MKFFALIVTLRRRGRLLRGMGGPWWGAGRTLINSIDLGTAFRVSFPLSGEQQEDEIFSGHQSCRRNLAALLFGPCRIGCSSFERKAE